MRDLTTWLKTVQLAVVMCLPLSMMSQSLTLTSAYDKARKNYPLIRQKELIARTASLNINNLDKNYLPQLSINGQATYQSDVTKVEVPIPNIKIDAPEKDQYKITADITQLVYDGGVTRQQKILQELNSSVSDQQVEVELYKLKDRINQLYLSILLLDQQVKQVDIVKSDIETGIKRVEAQVNNGVAFKSNLNVLKAELIMNDQRLIELRSSRKSLLQTLGLFLNEELPQQITLETPLSPAGGSGRAEHDATQNPKLPRDRWWNISRPELALFNNQLSSLNHQNKLISARNLPKTSLFFQGGYGRPGLNLLKNEFDLFYIGGIRFNWSLSGLYTTKNDRQLIKINEDIINSQKEAFLLNTNAELTKQQNEIEKLNDLINSDKEIIALRKTITDAAKAQLENGVITSSDYLREINAEDQSRQAMILHEVQLLQAKINYQTIIGK